MPSGQKGGEGNKAKDLLSVSLFSAEVLTVISKVLLCMTKGFD